MGVSEEMQARALVLQLWATQVGIWVCGCGIHVRVLVLAHEGVSTQPAGRSHPSLFVLSSSFVTRQSV